jgi:DNA-binding NarL/FixJ family response regulator
VEVQALRLRCAKGDQRVLAAEAELPRSSLAILSRREQQVLQFVARDKTDREIAALLGIGERTVRAHVSRIILKLGVASRVGAAVAFVEWTIRYGGSDVAEEPMATPCMDMSG